VSIVPDTKDWTWVLQRPCDACGFDAAEFVRDDVGRAIRENAAAWGPLLVDATAGARPRPDKWSALEYACHVRDVLGIFDRRLVLMLAEDDPAFENWDQDATAVAGHYDRQDPEVVARHIVDAADTLASRYDAVDGVQWARSGTRSDGSHFTVETLALYGLHDPIHHLWDVTGKQG
jgi:hypothetical protein